ncbi:MAG: hypothetical protein V4459_13010 [Pseudomonadota bacterium]
MVRLIPLAAVALALAACGDKDGNDSTQFSFNANDSEGAVTGGIDNGTLKIDAPGFKADIKVPKIALDANDFDMNGVHLYPGSKISSLNVDGGKDKDDDKVRVAFTSPASATTVRDWLKERLGKASYTLSTAGNGLTGKTEDGKPFKLELNDDGAGKSKGTIEMGG